MKKKTPHINLSVSLSDVGLLGELRWKTDDFPLDIVTPDIYILLDIHHNIITSRSTSYYDKKNCADMIKELRDLLNIYQKIERKHQYQLFNYIIADHALCKTLRLIDYFMSINNQKFIENIHVLYIDIVQWCADVIVCYLTKNDTPEFNIDIKNITPCMNDEINNGFPREFIDGDNHILSLLAVQSKQISTDSIVGVMLGGGSAAAIASSYYKSSLHFTKVSKYDDGKKCCSTIFGETLEEKNSITVIDDNCGTGQTLQEVKKIIAKLSDGKVNFFPVELHWEKFLRVNIYNHDDNVFNINDIDHLSPFAFRHHTILNRLLNEKNNPEYTFKMTLDMWIDYSRALIYLLHDTYPSRMKLTPLIKEINLIK